MEEQDDEITLQEALETQEMLENQSVAVLGASDPQNCSYSKGYMKRQALYSCLTCNPKGAPFAQLGGVCLACSYNCHEGHELVELFTKRNFRCDCGNKKFPDNPCKLQAEKDDFNGENIYNQNFVGLYCSCHRPYPDPDVGNDTAGDSMIQCIICEDWLHYQHCLAHLNIDFEEFETQDLELICGPCMSGLNFLSHYSHLTLKPANVSEKSEEQTSSTPEDQVVSTVEVENKTSSDDQLETAAPVVDQCATAAANSEDINAVGKPFESKQIDALSESSSSVQVPMNSSSSDGSIKRKREPEEQSKDHVMDTCSKDSGICSQHDSEEFSEETTKCALKKYSKKFIQFSDTQGVAWKGTLRSSLCRCTHCMDMYKTLKILYLLDEEDTIEHYEALGKKYTDAAKETAEASINTQVNQLGRVGQIELLHGYNHFKEQLAEFLKSHAESGKVVQREDVNKFFAKVNEEQAAKRRRLD